MSDPIVIVGGGLAGLACAGELHRRGLPFLLLEASEGVGGRVRTDEVEGFRLDRGFQVYFPAYPTASRVLADCELRLRDWKVGAQVWDGARLRTLDRNRPLLTLTDGVLGLPDLLRLARLSLSALRQKPAAIRALSDATTEAELRRRGFSEGAIRRFLRPFYGGVFVDLPLSVSRRQFLFVHRMLCLKPAAIPARGMEAISRALLAKVPSEGVRLDAPVDELLRSPKGEIVGVVSKGERIDARRVVLATDADTAESLSGLSLARGWLGSVALYFESDRPVTEGAYIVLNGTGKGRVNEVVPVSNAAPEYAPEGRHLICAVVVGDPPEPDAMLVEEVRREVRSWFPNAGDLRHLRTYRIRHHQLPQPPGFDAPKPTPPPGLVLAGELVTNCSIDGAIRSGILAAEACA